MLTSSTKRQELCLKEYFRYHSHNKNDLRRAAELAQQIFTLLMCCHCHPNIGGGLYPLSFPELSHYSLSHSKKDLKYNHHPHSTLQAKASGSVDYGKIADIKVPNLTYNAFPPHFFERSWVRLLSRGSVTFIIYFPPISFLSVSENSSMHLLLMSFSKENEERNIQFYTYLERGNGFVLLYFHQVS